MYSIKKLEPIFTNKVVDFYGVDEVITKANGDIILIDCKRPILTIKKGKPKLLIRHPSNWELIAIREFLLQNNYDIGDRANELRSMYG